MIDHSGFGLGWTNKTGLLILVKHSLKLILMKTFSMLKYTFLLSLSILLISSCTEQDMDEVKIGAHLPEAVLDKILELDGNPLDFQYAELPSIDGSTKRLVSETGVDAAISIDEFLNLSTKKQYRTEFLVDTDKYSTIDIYAFTGAGSFGLTTQSQRALADAVKNWNKVRLNSIHFNLEFNDNDAEYDPGVYEILAVAQEDLGFSGLAEFPYADGRPGTFIAVDSESVNLGNWSKDALEHIFTHELGHTIGFRHTDWQTRRSCVEAGVSPQEESEPFAELLPWTVPNIPGILYQKNSIMNACFNINTTRGELNSNDKRGLQNMYFDPFGY